LFVIETEEARAEPAENKTLRTKDGSSPLLKREGEDVKSPLPPFVKGGNAEEIIEQHKEFEGLSLEELKKRDWFILRFDVKEDFEGFKKAMCGILPNADDEGFEIPGQEQKEKFKAVRYVKVDQGKPDKITGGKDDVRYVLFTKVKNDA
jgi:hypothetical protein